ncbi:hypothetical protein [Nocardia cyriacigeorgica]|uniref:hypothetical protein n=1 Tax=Nocardia cyriacigeorgica TaxID=135487 RepID=UPI002453F334|nr:hypothetical protein [Nocardia cyriacigeorgica]
MTTTFGDSLKAALAKYMQDRHEYWDVAEVVDFREETRSGGFCETCAYTEVVIEVTYLDSSGAIQKDDIYDNFAGLVRELAKY